MKDPQSKTLIGSRHTEAKASHGYLFWRAFNAWSREVRVALEAIDLTQVQYSIMAATAYLGSTGEPVSQMDVARQLAMDKMMVSDVIKTLERKKLLDRKPHPHDGRAFALRLTTAGRSRLEQAVPIVEGVDAKFFGKLDAAQLKELGIAMARLSGLP